jgi:hypothetical protein
MTRRIRVVLEDNRSRFICVWMYEDGTDTHATVKKRPYLPLVRSLNDHLSFVCPGIGHAVYRESMLYRCPQHTPSISILVDVLGNFHFLEELRAYIYIKKILQQKLGCCFVPIGSFLMSEPLQAHLRGIFV